MQRNPLIGAKDKNTNRIFVWHLWYMKISNTGMTRALFYHWLYLICDGFAKDTGGVEEAMGTHGKMRDSARQKEPSQEVSFFIPSHPSRTRGACARSTENVSKPNRADASSSSSADITSCKLSCKVDWGMEERPRLGWVRSGGKNFPSTGVGWDDDGSTLICNCSVE